jgi:hypothetical protein
MGLVGWFDLVWFGWFGWLVIHFSLVGLSNWVVSFSGFMLQYH